MSVDQQLTANLAVWNHCRQTTLAKLDRTFEPGQLVYTLPNSTSHILWIAGHIAVPVEYLINRALTGRSTIPDEYQTLFGVGTVPFADASKYPPLDEIKEALAASFETALTIMKGLGPDDLAKPFSGPERLRDRFKSVAGVLVFMPAHEAYHSGQIEMLLRAQGLVSQ